MMRRMMKMTKQALVVILALATIFSLPGCGEKPFEDASQNYDRVQSYSETEPSKIDTAYPDDIEQTDLNVITVEKAEADLREHYNHECLEYGVITFDERKAEYDQGLLSAIIYCFNISVPYEYGNENYRAEVKYTKFGSFGNYELRFTDCDLQQETSELTKMGIWQYDDGETSVWINFKEKDENFYVAEYEISYCGHFQISGNKQITYRTNGEKRLYGEKEWNGDSYYLSMDLDCYDENGEEIKLGNIQVYPWSGVYWDSLYVNGGPYQLSN